GGIEDLDGRELGAEERLAPAQRPELSLKRDRGKMIARRRHQRRVGPPVGGGLVDLVRGAGAVAAAAYRVQAAPERDHREAAARLPARRAGGPRAARLVVLVDRARRGPAHASAAEAADHEEPALDDSRGRVVGGSGKGCTGLPAVGRWIVDLDRADGIV